MNQEKQTVGTQARVDGPKPDCMIGRSDGSYFWWYKSKRLPADWETMPSDDLAELASA